MYSLITGLIDLGIMAACAYIFLYRIPKAIVKGFRGK